MAAIKELLAYLLRNYPHKAEMSNGRVTKMIYLCDWKHSIDYGKQVTDISWYFDNYGPFVWDVLEAVESEPDVFVSEETSNFYGSTKTLLKLREEDYEPKLSPSERRVADHVISATQPLSWDSFIKLIYSTYPIVSSERYEYLNLPELAKEYKNSAVHETKQ